MKRASWALSLFTIGLVLCSALSYAQEGRTRAELIRSLESGIANLKAAGGKGEEVLSIIGKLEAHLRELRYLVLEEGDGGAIEALIVRSVDGDTVAARINGKEERIRYIGIDTPETYGKAEYYGAEASEFNRRLVEGQRVRLELDIEKYDRYGRLLAYVFLTDGTFVNAALMREGFARKLSIPPNVKYSDLFVKLEREAREEGRGLWGREMARTPGSSASGLVISEIQFSGKDEYVTITNTTSENIDMSAMVLVSGRGDQTYTFPSRYILKAGEVVRIHSGPQGREDPPNDLLWKKSYLWNNNGDVGVLSDSDGKELSIFSYGD